MLEIPMDQTGMSYGVYCPDVSNEISLMMFLYHVICLQNTCILKKKKKNSLYKRPNYYNWHMLSSNSISSVQTPAQKESSVI